MASEAIILRLNDAVRDNKRRVRGRLRHGGAWLVAALVLVEPSEIHAQVGQAPAEASRHFERGYLLAQEGDLEGAIHEFQRAYALQPHPSVLYNLGQAYAASGHAVEAFDTLERFLAESPASDVERRSHASALMQYQSQRIGFLALTVSPAEAQLSLDGVSLDRSSDQKPIRLTAGWHSVTAALDGYELRVSGAQITGKETTTLSLVLSEKATAHAQVQSSVNPARGEALQRLREERQRRAGLQRTVAIVGMGVGVASLTAAGILFASNQGAYADWRRESLDFADGLDSTGAANRNELNRLWQREAPENSQEPSGCSTHAVSTQQVSAVAPAVRSFMSFLLLPANVAVARPTQSPCRRAARSFCS